jgi:hypothetical protein
VVSYKNAPSQVTDGFNVESAQGFDLGFWFQTSAGSGRFTNGDLFSVNIALTGINENSFLFGNIPNLMPSLQNSSFYTAGHVQGISPNDLSSSIASRGYESVIPPQDVPEPATCALMAGGLGLLAIARRRRSK